MKVSSIATPLIFLLIGIVVWFLLPFQDETKRDQEIVESLETQILPFVQENDVSEFFDMDWCQLMVYRGGNVSETIDSTSTEDCGERLTLVKGFKRFTSDDKEFFVQLQTKLEGATGMKITQIDTEYPFNRPEQAVLFFEHKPLGMAFHIECFFCRTRYVYSPEYDGLPPNIEGEIFYIPINSNWYRVEQDWN